MLSKTFQTVLLQYNPITLFSKQSTKIKTNDFHKSRKVLKSMRRHSVDEYCH